jgi:hypothetical protein
MPASRIVSGTEAVQRCAFCDEVMWKTTSGGSGSIAVLGGLSSALDPTKFSDASAGLSFSRIRYEHGP